MAVSVKFVGPRLTSLVPEVAGAITERTCRHIASDVQSHMLSTAQRETPVRTGALRESWLSPLIEARGGRYTARIRNSHPLAGLLEHGARPHEIDPKDKRSVTTPEGERADVHHPGFAGSHAAAKAAAAAEVELPFVAEPALHEWVGAMEAAITEATKGT